MGITVNHSVVGTFGGSSTLADLKELVATAEAAGLTPSAKIYIDKYSGDQRDPSYTTITVRQR